MGAGATPGRTWCLIREQVSQQAQSGLRGRGSWTRSRGKASGRTSGTCALGTRVAEVLINWKEVI